MAPRTMAGWERRTKQLERSLHSTLNRNNMLERQQALLNRENEELRDRIDYLYRTGERLGIELIRARLAGGEKFSEFQTSMTFAGTQGHVDTRRH